MSVSYVITQNSPSALNFVLICSKKAVSYVLKVFTWIHVDEGVEIVAYKCASHPSHIKN